MDNINLTEFEKELRDKYGIESLDTYEKILKDCSDKELKLNDIEYQETNCMGFQMPDDYYYEDDDEYDE